MAQRDRSIGRLIDSLGRLPGIGVKSAERIAYHLLKADAGEAKELAAAIEAARKAVVACSTCFHLDVVDPCSICADPARDRAALLVLEDPREVDRFEDAGYRGLYHVLQGRLSPLEEIGPDDLTTAALFRRVRELAPAEVCLATNPDLEGEATARWIAGRLQELGVRVSRLARGLPAGASISQVSRSILADAIEGRRPFPA